MEKKTGRLGEKFGSEFVSLCIKMDYFLCKLHRDNCRATQEYLRNNPKVAFREIKGRIELTKKVDFWVKLTK